MEEGKEGQGSGGSWELIAGWESLSLSLIHYPTVYRGVCSWHISYQNSSTKRKIGRHNSNF